MVHCVDHNGMLHGFQLQYLPEFFLHHPNLLLWEFSSSLLAVKLVVVLVVQLQKNWTPSHSDIKIISSDS